VPDIEELLKAPIPELVKEKEKEKEKEDAPEKSDVEAPKIETISHSTVKI